MENSELISIWRDYIIIFGILFTLIFLAITTTLNLILFLKIKKILNYIENSLTEISIVKTKITETIPKPFVNVFKGFITLKGFIEALSKPGKLNKRKKRKKTNKTQTDE